MPSFFVALSDPEQQDTLLELTDEVDARLEYFQELEHATRMLNHPGESLVLQTDFLYMVERVDICIEYLKAHVRIPAPVSLSHLIVLHTAIFQRSGGVLVALPAMHDACHDAHQDVLRWFPEGSDGGYIQALI